MDVADPHWQFGLGAIYSFGLQEGIGIRSVALVVRLPCLTAGGALDKRVRIAKPHANPNEMTCVSIETQK